MYDVTYAILLKRQGTVAAKPLSGQRGTIFIILECHSSAVEERLAPLGIMSLLFKDTLKPLPLNLSVNLACYIRGVSAEPLVVWVSSFLDSLAPGSL